MLKPFSTKWPFLFKLRMFFGLIIITLVLILLYFKIVPFGLITYSRSWPLSYQLGQGFIGDFRSSTRIDLNVPQSNKMVLDQVYFLLFTPRRFDQTTITIQYLDKLRSDTPLIELGILKNKLTDSYDFQAILNNTNESNGYKTARATFDLSNADRSSGSYTFTIFVPGLSKQVNLGDQASLADQTDLVDKIVLVGQDDLANHIDIKNYLEIKKITINLKGKTLWQKIWEL